VDARGVACPIPVTMTRNALAKSESAVVVLVDDNTARENVSRFAYSRGCEVEITQREGGFELKLTPGETQVEEKTNEAAAEAATAFLVTSDELGKGERELGVRLMRMFLYTAAESGGKGTAVFMNTGVRLAADDEEAAASISRLVDQGWKVLVCGTCLDYYGLKDGLKAGTVSNMYEIQSALVGADSVVSL
jgi:selenium metabolism protein YedF